MSGQPKQECVQTGKTWRPAGKRQNRNSDEAQTVGQAILRLRRGAGMTLRQLAASRRPRCVSGPVGKAIDTTTQNGRRAG